MIKNYKTRREKLQQIDSKAAFLFFGNVEQVRNDDVTFSFRQESSFYYLTGFTEPHAILLLVEGKSYMWVQPKNLEREVWEGERYGKDQTKELFEIDETFELQSRSEFLSQLEKLLVQTKKIYYTLGKTTKNDELMVDLLKALAQKKGRGHHSLPALYDPTALLAKLRMVKDEAELKKIKQAVSISVNAHTHLMNIARAGLNEADLAREFYYEILKQGGSDLGYPSIVASGKGATTLHYVKNNAPLKENELVLIDAGGEYQYYTADITHTFPIGKKFSEAQKKVYQKVLSVNQEITQMIKPGVTYQALQEHTVNQLTEALLSLGILQGTLEENVKNKTYRKYYMHGVGHHLGLDVHDTSLYDEDGVQIKLEAGMVLTNEPGLYFRDEGNEYSGIGVRIEDDILVTPHGSENLSKDLPREMNEIENIRAQALSS